MKFGLDTCCILACTRARREYLRVVKFQPNVIVCFLVPSFCRLKTPSNDKKKPENHIAIFHLENEIMVTKKGVAHSISSQIPCIKCRIRYARTKSPSQIGLFTLQNSHDISFYSLHFQHFCSMFVCLVY